MNNAIVFLSCFVFCSVLNQLRLCGLFSETCKDTITIAKPTEDKCAFFPNPVETQVFLSFGIFVRRSQADFVVFLMWLLRFRSESMSTTIDFWLGL